jgi:hypothetical protein
MQIANSRRQFCFSPQLRRLNRKPQSPVSLPLVRALTVLACMSAV